MPQATSPQPHPSDPWQDGPTAPRPRRALLAAGVYGLLVAVVPLFAIEFYPFSRAPMFADAPQLYCEYHIFAPDGGELPAVDFGVQRNYWGNPVGVGCGWQPPSTVDRFGEVPDEEEVTAVVVRHLNEHHFLDYVEVTQDVIGPIDAGIGVVAHRRWRVGRTARGGREQP